MSGSPYSSSAGHVATPFGEIALWRLLLPPPLSRARQRQHVRAEAQELLMRHYPVASWQHAHWPPNVPTPLSEPQRLQSEPALWLSWSYLQPAAPQALALLAIAPFPVGIDLSAGHLLDLEGWDAVLQLYGGIAAPPDPLDCARLWTRIEAAEKCVRTGLREWSVEVQAQRSRCELVELPLASTDLAAALAWLPPRPRPAD